MELRPYLLPPFVFAVVGPGMGILTALISHPSSGPPGSMGVSIMIMYVIGLIPALVSGCLYVVLWPLFSRLRMLGKFGIGCVTGLATAAPMLVYRSLSLNASKGSLFTLIFAIPAALCSVLAAKIRAGETHG